MGVLDAPVSPLGDFCELEASGDSWGAGIGSVDKVHGYNAQLAALLGIPLINHSIGSAIAAWPKTDLGAVGDGGFANVLQDVTTINSTGDSFEGGGSLASISYGFNGLWNNGHTAGIARDISALRLIISRYRAAMMGGPSFFTGSTNVILGATGNSGDGLLWHKSSASPATETFTVPAKMPAACTPVIYGQMWPGAAGDITFTVNGVAYPAATVDLDTCANTLAINLVNGWAARFPDAVAGDVIVATATYSVGPVTFNGVMIEPEIPPVVIVRGCPHLPIIATDYGWANTGAMNADFDAMNTAQAALCAEFDDDVIFYDPTPDIPSVPYGTAGSLYNSDNLHLYEAGHRILAQQIAKRLKHRPLANKLRTQRRRPRSARTWDVISRTPRHIKLPAGQAAGTYVLIPSTQEIVALTDPKAALEAFYIDKNEHGGNVKIRIKGWVIPNAVAQTATFTFELLPIATWGGGSGSDPTIATVGAAMATAAVAAPAAGVPKVQSGLVGVTSTLTHSGWFVLALVQSAAAVAASGQCLAGQRLEVQTS